MHMSTCIIKLMVVLMIYLVCKFVPVFVFKTYTPLTFFLGLYNSSLDNLIIHLT